MCLLKKQKTGGPHKPPVSAILKHKLTQKGNSMMISYLCLTLTKRPHIPFHRADHLWYSATRWSQRKVP